MSDDRKPRLVTVEDAETLAKLTALVEGKPKKKEQSAPRIIFNVVVVLFACGLAMGACTLGMKIPGALWDLAVPPVAPR